MSLQISSEFRNLKPIFQEVISDITKKMGSGMTVFLTDKVDSMTQWDEVSMTCGYDIKVIKNNSMQDQVNLVTTTCIVYTYSRKLSREKIFVDFKDLGPFVKVLFVNIVCMCNPYPVYSTNPQRFSLRNLHACCFAKVFSLE